MIVIIDDILIYSRSKNDHMKHLRTILQVLKDNQLFAKFNKCEFWLRSLAFLGNISSIDGVEFDLRKMEVVKSFPRPLKPADIQSFLGLFGYYRRFVEGFLSIESPLTNLSKNNSKFKSSESCEKNFQLLKDRLASTPVLTLRRVPKGVWFIVMPPEWV